jgi:hypothetical protein
MYGERKKNCMKGKGMVFTPHQNVPWNENMDYVHLVQVRVQGQTLKNIKDSFVCTIGNVLIR